MNIYILKLRVKVRVVYFPYYMDLCFLRRGWQLLLLPKSTFHILALVFLSPFIGTTTSIWSSTYTSWQAISLSSQSHDWELLGGKYMYNRKPAESTMSSGGSFSQWM